jgi:NAD(P)H-dependent FMN reductase
LIVGISGSLRQKSYNTALLRAAVALAPEKMKIEIASIRDVPLYDGDVEDAGIPAPVAALKDAVAASDGLLLVTPEYNFSIPGVLKNAIDWLSRPSKDIARVFANRAVGLIGATTGPSGTRFAQTAFLPVFRTLRVRPFFGRALYLAKAAAAFDEAGRLVDETVKKELVTYLSEFATFVG